MNTIKADKEKLAELARVSANTMRKANQERKEELLGKQGYEIIDTVREGRNIYYTVAPIEEGLVEVIGFLRDRGFTNIRNIKALISCIISWNNESVSSVRLLAEQVGVSPKTAYDWKERVDEIDLFRIGRKEVAVKIASASEQPIECTDVEWQLYLQEQRKMCSDGLISPLDFYYYWRDETGYFFKKYDKMEPNGFYNQFFSLVEKLSLGQKKAV